MVGLSGVAPLVYEYNLASIHAYERADSGRSGGDAPANGVRGGGLRGRASSRAKGRGAMSVGNFGRPEIAAEYARAQLFALGDDLALLRDTAALTGQEWVVDIGTAAGHTALALAPGARRILGLDPAEAMLRQARRLAGERGIANLDLAVAFADPLPCRDETVDLVTCRLAAHHFPDLPGAIYEVARVLRPGGTLGLIWNARDGRVDWVRRFTEIMHASAAEEMLAAGGPVVAAPFGELESERWEWLRPMTRAQLHRMADSRSHLITASAEDRSRIHADMDALFDELRVAEDATIDLPYVTWAYRVSRP